MPRPLILAPVLSLAMLAGAPAAALAQAFPASAAVVASPHSLRPDTRAIAPIDRGAAAGWRAPATETALPPTARLLPLKLSPRIALAHGDVPQVDIRAKADWSDDQGLRATPTKVSFKRRF